MLQFKLYCCNALAKVMKIKLSLILRPTYVPTSTAVANAAELEKELVNIANSTALLV